MVETQHWKAGGASYETLKWEESLPQPESKGEEEKPDWCQSEGEESNKVDYDSESEAEGATEKGTTLALLLYQSHLSYEKQRLAGKDDGSNSEAEPAAQGSQQSECGAAAFVRHHCQHLQWTFACSP